MPASLTQHPWLSGSHFLLPLILPHDWAPLGISRSWEDILKRQGSWDIHPPAPICHWLMAASGEGAVNSPPFPAFLWPERKCEQGICGSCHRITLYLPWSWFLIYIFLPHILPNKLLQTLCGMKWSIDRKFLQSSSSTGIVSALLRTHHLMAGMFSCSLRLKARLLEFPSKKLVRISTLLLWLYKDLISRHRFHP